MVDLNADAGVTGDAGVGLVRYVVGHRIGWLFREQPSHDYGIDAHAESRNDHGDPTGRILAMQIKAGPSYFSREYEDGWEHPVKAKHAAYWLNHALPVIVILVNLDEDRAYWAQVTPETLIPTRKNFKLRVPRTNGLAWADSAWRDILETALLGAVQRFEENLATIPPSTYAPLREIAERDPSTAALIAATLASYRAEPETGIRELIEQHRTWLDAGGSPAWRAIANFSLEHDHHELCAQSLLEAARTNSDKASEFTALAAIQLSDLEPDRADELLIQAAQTQPVDDVTIAVARTLRTPAMLDPGSPAYDTVANRLINFSTGRVITRTRLAAHALSNGQLGSAIEYFEAARQLSPDSSRLMVALSDTYIRKSQTGDAGEHDLPRAERLATDALEQQRRWRNDTAVAATTLIRALGLQTKYGEALDRSLPEPDGRATPDEAANAAFARAAVVTAERARRPDLIPGIIERIRDPRERELARRLSHDGTATDEEQIALRLDLLDSGLDDTETIVTTVLELAGLGVDGSDRITAAAEHELIPEHLPELVRAIALAQHAPADAIPTLRRLANHERIAAEALVDTLRRAGQLDEAIIASQRGFATYRMGSFIESEVRLLRASDRTDEADQRLNTAVARHELSGQTREQALLILAERASQDGDWNRAAELMHMVVNESPGGRPTNHNLWNLILCELRSGRPDYARNVLKTHNPSPRNPQEIGLWLEVHNATGWTPEAAHRAMTLAVETDDPDLATALIGSVIHNTKGVAQTNNDDDDELGLADARPEVPGEIHARAFQLLDELIERHGADAIAIKRIDIIETNFIDQLRDLAESSSTTTETLDAIHSATVPLGMLSLLRKTPYGLTNVRHDSGIRVVSTADPDLHEVETTAAGHALGSTVVVDLSAICLALELESYPTARDAFLDVLIVRSSRADAIRSSVEARTSSASVGYMSTSATGLEVREAEPAEHVRVIQLTNQLEGAVHQLTEVASPTNFTALAAVIDHMSPEPWLDNIEYAAQHGLPFWSDDLAQRNVARAVGVDAFGTVNILEASRLASLPDNASEVDITQFIDVQVDLLTRLVHLRAADQPVTPTQLAEIIRDDDGQPLGAESVLARPAWWLQQGTIAAWEPIRDLLSELDSDAKTLFLRRAMDGVASIQQSDATHTARLLALLAVTGLNRYPTPEDGALALRIAEAAATRRNLESPRTLFAEAVAHTAREVNIDNAAEFIQQVLRILDDKP
ncbi:MULTISPECIES: DUF4365 domain-containing protein [unclassified Agromyces]|uniref:DUF4365 domain-containing protein n=1 Tax=unclassified Agromyces TaxID=2639701 RepID=UPI00301451A9